MSGRAATTTVIPGRAALSVGDPATPTPPGWRWFALSDVATMGTGHTPSRKVSGYWGGDVPWIGLRDAGAHHGAVIHDTMQHITRDGLANSSARILPAGTVCLSRTASVGYVTMMGREMATSQDFVTWTADPASLESRFLMWAILAEGDGIRAFGKGTTHTTIYFPEAKALHICLPGLAEQRRIVSKLDAVMARTASARAELDRVPALAAKFKQALLTQVLGERTTGLKRVPLHSQLVLLTSGSRDWAEYYDKGDAVFVLAGNVKPMRFDPAPKRFVDPPRGGADARRSRITEGDLLLTIVGAGTGELCAVPPLNGEYFVCQSVALIRLKEPKLSRFYEYWFQSERFGRSDMQAVMYGAARPHLGFEDIREFPVPDIAVDEASAAVTKLDAGLAEIDRLAAQAAAARRLLDRLDGAILAKAFQGELVPPDSNEEPASALLERIRVKRARGAVNAKHGPPKVLA